MAAACPTRAAGRLRGELARGDLPKAIVEVPPDYRGADRGGKSRGAPGKNKKKG